MYFVGQNRLKNTQLFEKKEFQCVLHLIQNFVANWDNVRAWPKLIRMLQLWKEVRGGKNAKCWDFPKRPWYSGQRHDIFFRIKSVISSPSAYYFFAVDFFQERYISYTYFHFYRKILEVHWFLPYQNLPSLFNLWTGKTIHANLCKTLLNWSQKE